MPQAAAIYARISQDREGDGLGVQRQLEDCRAEALRRGWSVEREYVDDDVSAYSGKSRPAYEQMLNDLTHGRVDAVLVWHLDRLHRRPIELEAFVQTCAAAGVKDVVTLHGDFDLGSGDGLLVARLLSAVAANESDSKRRRGRRKSLQIAQAGAPNMGGPRPFGYLEDRVTPHPTEAKIYQQLASRALAGESLASLARWLDENEIRTVQGNKWASNVVRGILINPRYWGKRAFNGEVIADAVWPALIPAEQGERLRALLTDPSRVRNGTARRYLLSGMCRCGLCDTKMYSVPRFETRRYLCRSGVDFGGCGKMTISAVPLEELITEAVLIRLDTPDLATALAQRAAGTSTDTSDLQLLIEQDVSQLEELAGLYAARSISATEWVQARTVIEARLNQSRSRLTRVQGFSAIDEFIGNGDALRSQWRSLNLDRQRAIVAALLSHVVIHPGRKTNRLDPNRVQPVWRL